MSSNNIGPRGAPDVLPPESELLSVVKSHAQALFDRYGYRRIETPVFEHSEVFLKSTGESSDIVVQKQMYSFEDLSQRSLTLRPEGTPGVVRAFVEHKLWGSMPSPQKFFYDGPMFRYEAPQEGRKRQFIQIGVELFGSNGPLADVEVMAIGADFFAAVGLEPELLVNSVGCSQDRARFAESVREQLRPRYDDLCSDCHVRLEKNPLRVFDCKVVTCAQIVKGLDPISSHLCDACSEHFGTVKAMLSAADIDYVEAPGLVRGLDYYTRTIFEFDLASLGARSAVCGGGRYDNLVEQFGGPATPAVGFAIGVEPTMVALRARGDRPDWKPDAYVAWFGADVAPAALRLGASLRRAGQRVLVNDDESRSMKSQLRSANRHGAETVYILGPQELERGVVTVKNMTSGEQSEAPLDQTTKESS